MNSVYLGVRIPDIPYEKVLVENVNVEESIESLIDEAEKRFKIAKEEIGGFLFIFLWQRC